MLLQVKPSNMLSESNFKFSVKVFNFLLNNVNGLQLSKKRSQMFEYFKTKIDPKGILFLQETHSSIEIEKKWNDEFNGQLFFLKEKQTPVV